MNAIVPQIKKAMIGAQNTAQFTFNCFRLARKILMF